MPRRENTDVQLLLTPPTFLIITEHTLIFCGSSGPWQGVMPKPGFYEGFYIHFDDPVGLCFLSGLSLYACAELSLYAAP